MTSQRRSSFVSLSFLLVACGGGGSAQDLSASRDLRASADLAADLADDIDYAAESNDTASHGSAPDALSTSKALSSLFVKEDPTLDVSLTAVQNADAVAAQLGTSVTLPTCATSSVIHTTGTVGVSVTFGTGCTLPNIGSITGSASATIGKLAGTITVTLTLTNITVNGEAVNGSVALSTTNATTFDVTANLSTSTQQISFKGTAVIDANGAGVTLNGTATSTKAGESLDFTLTNVHHDFSACYADAGTMAVAKPTKNKRDMTMTLEETITFSSTTPSTGMVTVTISGVTTASTLPATGSCPHT